jgi:hypothetical protein
MEEPLRQGRLFSFIWSGETVESEKRFSKARLEAFSCGVTAVVTSWRPI